MRNVTSRTANYAHSSRRNDYETLSLWYRSYSFVRVSRTRRSRVASIDLDPSGEGCLTRAYLVTEATFQYRTIPRFINIHSWNEVIYMCWYHLLKRSSLLHVDQTLFLSNTRANRQERCTSTLQIEPFHRQELITRNFHRWKREEERESIEEPETWLNGSIPRVRPDALIPAINSSTCLVAMGRSLWKRIVIFVGESLR